MEKTPVIYDGDMGGDDLWAIAMLLAHRDRFDLLGIASVFGNVSQPFATQNVLNFLHWLGEDDIPVVQGFDMPYDGMRPFGDDAYGTDGVGGVSLPLSPRQPEAIEVTNWYDMLLNASPVPVTIFATGPVTNLSHFLSKHPDKVGKIKEIILMSGGMRAPGKDGEPVLLGNGDIRAGNITPYAEFNAYQDPKALNTLLKSGVRCVFMAADASQFMVLNPARQQQLLALDSVYAPALHRMLIAVEKLDRMKFGVDGPFIHDPNVVIYALRPDLYKGRELPSLSFLERVPQDERRGQAVLEGENANALWLNGIKDADEIFSVMLESLKATIAQASRNRVRLAG